MTGRYCWAWPCVEHKVGNLGIGHSMCGGCTPCRDEKFDARAKINCQVQALETGVEEGEVGGGVHKHKDREVIVHPPAG